MAAGDPILRVSTSTWASVSFINSWVDYGGAYDTCQYMKDACGVVHLKGLMKSGTIGAAAFRLPSGYRPSAIQSFANVSNAAFCEIDITSDGYVTPANGNNTWLSISGISFVAA